MMLEKKNRDKIRLWVMTSRYDVVIVRGRRTLKKDAAYDALTTKSGVFVDESEEIRHVLPTSNEH